MSNRYLLAQAELDELEYEHRHTSAMRIDLKPCTCRVVASTLKLWIGREGVRNMRYRKGGLVALLRNDAGSSECALNGEQR
jgi:hypothetical protein